MKIRKKVMEEIIGHARRDAPVEACGYLAGKDDVIALHYELTNTDKSREHFSFDPKEQFETARKARANGLELYAVYHSHPETPARPSKEDVKLAFDPDISYVIVSLADGKEAINSFKIANGKVEAEKIEIVE
jgi:proteasome lid subunit RPN8/RPN11